MGTRPMTELERFKAVVHFERPDYWPLFAAHALGSPHAGALLKLHREGLPEHVRDEESWFRYWGEVTYDRGESIGAGAPGIESESWIEGEFEFIQYETGARTRQVVDNDVTYSMPDFQEFHVRDRASWEKYRELTTPVRKETAKLAEMVRRFAGRTRPLAVSCGGTWGVIRSEMGPHRALLAVHDEPDLLREMLAHKLRVHEEFTFPVIEALRPEIILMWEDFCYNHGMLISPDAFREFCAPHYRRVAEVGRACGAELLIVDCDGKVDEYCLLLEEVGFNGCCPMEQVCGNDLLACRKAQPRFIFCGGIEKEVASTGNAARIEPEIFPKVPRMLEGGGYFPMFDHALSTNLGFEEHCRCMTLLHELCGSAELGLGEFPRMQPG
ncbi:MAG: uroporphyrinogen decarboxylase family protein [Phycisphaerae bacterium]